MAKPLLHAEHSAQKYGGVVEDYIPIHNFIDSSKAHVPDIRHRALLHNSFGIYLTEQVFGVYIVNSDGKKVSVRDVAEDHIKQDMGTIPTVQDWLKCMGIQDWMLGHKKPKTTRHFDFD
jgi:hypothetical protein